MKVKILGMWFIIWGCNVVGWIFNVCVFFLKVLIKCFVIFGVVIFNFLVVLIILLLIFVKFEI